MKCFCFSGGSIVAGFVVRKDDKLGEIIFLGEDGRGRRYEKVGFLRKDPAEIIDGKVFDAHPVKITINRGEKNEKSFYVLAKPQSGNDQRILVRVDTCTGYVRGGAGGYKALKGNPETVVHAYGAYGDAGRIGSWDDDLVVMSPGDVINVHGSRSGSWIIDFSDPSRAPEVLVRQDWDAKQAIDNAEDMQWL